VKWERNEGKEEGKNQIKDEEIFNLQPHPISHVKCMTDTDTDTETETDTDTDSGTDTNTDKNTKKTSFTFYFTISAF